MLTTIDLKTERLPAPRGIVTPTPESIWALAGELERDLDPGRHETAIVQQ